MGVPKLDRPAYYIYAHIFKFAVPCPRDAVDAKPRHRNGVHFAPPDEGLPFERK